MNRLISNFSLLFRTTIFTMLAVVTLPISAFCQSEEIFKAALNYTVKVRTAVELPFDEEERQRVSKGAGFVVDKDRGWVLTNAHVASRSPSANEVSFRDTEYIKAEKVYVDPYLDLAVLKVPPGVFPSNVTNAALECSRTPPTGHAVGAFGHPHSMSYTGTRGIISGRTVKFGPEFVQTDTPINRGNSGGPLVSMVTGRVVGINTAKVTGGENLNLAVPIEHTCKILNLLRLGKDPSPPELPVMFLKNSLMRKQLKVAVSYLKNSELDLRPGDIIDEVVGHADDITNESALVLALRGRLSDVRLVVVRNDETVLVKGKLKPIELITERKAIFVSGLVVAPSRFYKDGAEMRVHRQLTIAHVDRGSIGASKEIRENDFIHSIDGHPIHDFDELYGYLEAAAQEKDSVKLLIRRSAGSDKNELFEYHEHSLPLKDLRLVGEKK